MSAQTHPGTLRCTRPVRHMDDMAVLYALNELAADERAALESHARECAACSAVLQRELDMYQALASPSQPADTLDPDGLLLAQCRNELAEALDQIDEVDQVHGGARRLKWWNAIRDTLVLHPAFSLAVLAMAGFLAGVLSQRWPSGDSTGARPVLTVWGAPKLTDELLRSALQTAGSASVNWVTPAGSRSPSVQVQLMSQTPLSITGSPEDADVRRALTFVLANGKQFDPPARLNSLDVLRSLSTDVDVLQTLCEAARTDGNPGVRIKALETLQGLEANPLVLQTLMDALASDTNPGVRVQAINRLVGALRSGVGSDPRVIGVLRDRLRNDSNTYVRLQSGVALRQLGAQ